ncbi:MAG: tRNA pseudouridine(55) synthase TruB, partial [Syntrophales bacterium]|nr:tRNA pseudouridine(55) synthase TruB [Syntrophales bacterium]
RDRRKAGHTGTLDPLATGVLLVCLNEATKLVPYLTDLPKEYRATLLLGVETDTFDIAGNIVARREPNVDEGEVRRLMEGLTGRIVQRPPVYSAIKYRGRALYDWARKGVTVEAPLREVEVYRLKVEDVKLPYVSFSVTCSSGTYVRSLCADVGRELGCGACLAALRRVSNGRFHEGMAVAPDDREGLRRGMLTMADAVAEMPTIVVDATVARSLRNGVTPRLETMNDVNVAFLKHGDVLKFVTQNGRLVAIAAYDTNRTAAGEKGTFTTLRVFHDEVQPTNPMRMSN